MNADENNLTTLEETQGLRNRMRLSFPQTPEEAYNEH